ncbi:hypothetical protein SDC9_205993 [bioreactor metagenome]|uniref:Uncharacterized protein n=1 Tax=bioreactor metagenome TaxID=1076179 RepID=A0A645J577_9ZZZZ
MDNTAIITTPTQLIKTGGVKWPIEINVASLFTTRPQLIKPIIAMNKPIPPDTANFIFTGIAFTTASRTLNNDKNMKIIPSTNTAVKATSQDTPIPKTTV